MFGHIPHSDPSEKSKAKVTVEMPHSSVNMRVASQLPAVRPDDDLTGMLLQVGRSIIFIYGFKKRPFLCQIWLVFFHFCTQIFPLKVDPRWHGPPPSQLSLALQQALAKELMRAKQGQIQQGGLSFRLLQAIAALLTSAHAGPIVMSMHRSHALSCPLVRQLHLYQVACANSRSLRSHFPLFLILIVFSFPSVLCPRTLLSHPYFSRS